MDRPLATALDWAARKELDAGNGRGSAAVVRLTVGMPQAPAVPQTLCTMLGQCYELTEYASRTSLDTGLAHGDRVSAL